MTRAGDPILRRPGACTPEQRAGFAELVCEGFNSHRDTLGARILAARSLGFHYTDGSLCGIAALKPPDAATRSLIFHGAGATASPDDYHDELGWLYVVPERRRQGIAGDLVKRLLATVPAAPVFATTRRDNAPAQQLLRAFAFRRVGQPFRRRDEELLLFLRPG